jgi:hypothetical protein
MELNSETQECQAEKCCQHPEESNVFFCIECQEVICKKCCFPNSKHFKHGFQDVPDGLGLLKQRVAAASNNLKDLVSNAKQRQADKKTLNQAITADTSAVIQQINRYINGVINELETMRIDLTTFAIHIAQEQQLSSVQQADVLTDLHIRRSGLQGALQLRLVDRSRVSKLTTGINIAGIKQQELQLLAQRQQQRREQLQVAQAQVHATVQTLDEHWVQEMNVTLDYVQRLSQYTNSMTGRHHGGQQVLLS